MLLIFSSHSNNSEQVLREVQLATDSRLAIVRFRIEDVALTDDLRYFLSSPHWLDALTPPLSNHIARLEVAIKELLASSTEVSGKNVVDDPVEPEVSPVTPPAAAVPPSAVAPAMPPPPPPLRQRIDRAESSRAGYSRVRGARARARPTEILQLPGFCWRVGAVVLFAAAIGVLFFVLRPAEGLQATGVDHPHPGGTDGRGPANSRPAPGPDSQGDAEPGFTAGRVNADNAGRGDRAFQ